MRRRGEDETRVSRAHLAASLRHCDGLSSGHSVMVGAEPLLQGLVLRAVEDLTSGGSVSASVSEVCMVF